MANEIDPPSLVRAITGPAIRAVLNSAPFTGGVASLWSDWDSSRRFARVEKTMQDLASRLEAIKPAFDPNRLGEAEMQLLEDVLERVSREHREWKRRCFVELLAANWVNTSLPFEERHLFDRALDRFEEIHIRILRLLARRAQDNLEPIHANELYRKVLGGSTDEEVKFGVFMPAMTMLSSEFGFIRRRGEDSGSKMFNVNPDGLAFHTKCLILPRGQSFISSLGDSGPPVESGRETGTGLKPGRG